MSSGFVSNMKTQHTKAEYTLTKNEVQEIINAAKNFRDRVLIKTLYYCGMRVSEAIHLKPSHIEFERKRINVLFGKGGKTRTIPVLSPEHLSDLKHLMKKDDNLFFPVKRRQVQNICYTSAQICGVKHPDPLSKHVNPHLFRHCIARHLKDSGYPLEFIQKFLGHSSMKTTSDVYGTLSINDMHRIIATKTGDRNVLPGVQEINQIENSL